MTRRRAQLTLILRLAVAITLALAWFVLTEPGLVPAFFFSTDTQAAFFFGQPVKVLETLWAWVASGEILPHLGVTLLETLLAFLIGTASGLVVGLFLALNPLASAVADPFLKGLNAMPRVILAPIFAVWFGLGIWSKVFFGTTLVFFIVFFNVYQGTREVSTTVLASVRMLGVKKSALLRHVYLPAATSWVFSSLHTSIGMAFVGAVVGEYLGSAKGVGYLIHQAEAVFDINTVLAGIFLLTVFALVLDTMVTRLERRLLVWHPNAAATR
jgi:NitT/TauT family transport system permease protein